MVERASTVKQIAERFGVGEHTVLAWLKSGELRAINVGRTAAKLKPRWRITQEALAEFELRRQAEPPLPRTRRKKRSTGVIEFY